jgi:flagellar hook assembly protein FlgD
VTPEKTVLFQNYPNPFNPSTRIAFDLAVDADVKLSIYDVTGRRVRTLLNGFRTAGVYNMEWNGRDESGRWLASGVYFYRLTAHGVTTTKKSILIR